MIGRIDSLKNQWGNRLTCTGEAGSEKQNSVKTSLMISGIDGDGYGKETEKAEACKKKQRTICKLG